jgi:hypothetical protein
LGYARISSEQNGAQAFSEGNKRGVIGAEIFPQVPDPVQEDIVIVSGDWEPPKGGD